MLDGENGCGFEKYVCPDSAGPHWRQAWAAGIDMAMIESNLRKSPWERMEAHDEALSFVTLLQHSRRTKDAGAS